MISLYRLTIIQKQLLFYDWYFRLTPPLTLQEQKAELEKEVASIIDERDKLSEQLKLNSNNKDKEKHKLASNNNCVFFTVLHHLVIKILLLPSDNGVT